MAFIYSHETHHLSFSLLLTLSSLFCFCRSHEKVHGTSSILVQQQREFDYFLLALQWPGTVCQHTQRCCPSNGCCKSSSAPVGFTIHGLWANYNDGSWPSCCSESSFDIKEIQPLLDGLQKYWPSFRCGSTRTCNGGKGIFWAHEWEKHGTCSTSVLRDEYTFFSTTINLYLKYNITEILTEAGYPPSNVEKYPLGGVVSAIENAVRATPQLVCSRGAIKELHICFYKDFKPRDCNIHGRSNGHMLASSSCPSYISIPEFVPSGLESNVSVPWIPSDEAM